MNTPNSRFPYLPNELGRLADLAYNLWFSWHDRAIGLFRMMDEKLWENVHHNPVKLLHQIDHGRLKELAANTKFIEKYSSVVEAFDNYMNEDDTWFTSTYPKFKNRSIAYLSMEFGIHQCLPIYSGGLGILAGDHLKSASDLGIPLIGLGLLYRESYFTQFISSHGHQQAVYLHNDFSSLAITQVKDENGKTLVIQVNLGDRNVSARVWKVQVGRVPLFLLDTDFTENAADDRRITERLYVADRDHRLIQEMLLGIGGVAAFTALGYSPDVWHMNEGHSSFSGIERIRRSIQEGIGFEQAKSQVKSSSVFTTHTPVPAGNEVFSGQRIEQFLKTYWESMGLTKDQFFKLAQFEEPDDPNAFNMTILALQLSGCANGVSELHGQVARRMWHRLWPDRPVKDVPITSITNGVHARTWMADEIKNLLDEYLSESWRYEQSDLDIWKTVDQIPDDVLWTVHQELKSELINLVRRRIVAQKERNGETAEAVKLASTFLDPNILTVGFARRFAPYKRSTLLFQDRDRLLKILGNHNRPVQILFAGKAHPANSAGKALIQQVYGESTNPEFGNRILFVENYDMAFARRLVAGVDVWLNTPRRPFEASGTSGMKVAMNGGLNLSILDGWWREGYNGQNGWAIGEDREFYNDIEQDESDNRSLYHRLENEIIPLFYNRNSEGLPQEWITMMRNSIKSIIPQFNTHRMLKEYTNDMYLRAMQSD